MGRLFVKAFSRYFLGVILVGLLLFLPAWSFRFWQGWLLMGILFIPMFFAGLVMMWKNPSLLEKRLSAKEEQNEQKTIVAGLNWRYNWCVLPDWASRRSNNSSPFCLPRQYMPQPYGGVHPQGVGQGQGAGRLRGNAYHLSVSASPSLMQASIFASISAGLE